MTSAALVTKHFCCVENFPLLFRSFTAFIQTRLVRAFFLPHNLKTTSPQTLNYVKLFFIFLFLWCSMVFLLELNDSDRWNSLSSLSDSWNLCTLLSFLQIKTKLTALQVDCCWWTSTKIHTGINIYNENLQ